MTRASNFTASYDTDIFLSASQIGTWNQCKRKWGYSYLDRIKTPSHPSAELGQRVHAVLEAWLKDGVPFNLSTEEGQIASSGLQYLPLPGSAEVEAGFVVQTETAKYRGFIDARFREELPVILDHKTTSDLRWAKTEEDLRKDVQATLYAAEAMLRTGSDAVELRWIYYTTRKPYKSRKVSLVVVKDEIEANFDAIDRTAAEMLTAYRDNRSGSELPASPTACGAYGGCPYLALKVCTLSPKDMLRAHLESDSQGRNSTMSMSLAEKLKERKQWRPHPDHPGFEYNPATNETRPITTQHHAAPPAPPGPMFAATPPAPPASPPAAPPSPPLAAAAPPPPPAPPALSESPARTGPS
jgi:RecB family exonuclease